MPGKFLKKTKKIEAGSKIFSRCPKCKEVVNHTVLSLVDGEIARVECSVCGSSHKYRPVKPAAIAAAKRKITRAASLEKERLARAEAYFEKLMANRDQAEARTYSMNEVYKPGELLDHPTFGPGVIIDTVLPDKIEVLFRQGSRLLVCGRLCK